MLIKTPIKNVNLIDMKRMKKILPVALLLFVMLGISAIAKAQADPIEGIWLNEEKDAKIQIYKGRDGLFYGKIIWLKEPTENGAPKLDKKNPHEDKRKQQILGLIILRKFEKDGKTYDDGTIYDPTNGKTYDATINYKGNKLDLRGYVGISLFGRTTTWERTQ
jgi:uncharacterized protein (DUF2147 family)